MSHATIIQDDVVEGIADAVGFTALGIYALLERRVNRDGRAVVNYTTIAEAGKLSKRQVLRIMGLLADAGYVVVEGRVGNFGVAIHLPFHRTGGATGGDAGGDIGGDTGGDTAASTYIRNKSSKSSQSSKSSRATTLPDDLGEEIVLAEALKCGVPEDRVMWVHMQFRDYWRSNGQKKVDWVAAWRTWCRNQVKWDSERKGRAIPQISDDSVRMAKEMLEARRALRAKEVAT